MNYFATSLREHPALAIVLTLALGFVIGRPALRAVQGLAQSKIPVLGYTVPYAIAAIVMAAWGPVIVMLLT